jgi:hypothetical protein
MVTDVTQRANLENQIVSGGFITPSEVRGYLNEGLRELWEKLVAARGQESMRKQAIFSTTSGVSGYPIPADMFELLSVDISLTPSGTLLNQQWFSARPYMEAERNRFKFFPGLTGWYFGAPIYYRIKGSAQMAGPAVLEKLIDFQPTPQASYQFALNYFPRFAPFATDGSQDNYVFDAISGWTGFAVWYAVALCKAKLNENGDFAAAQVARFEERIAELADQNDAGNAEQIQDREQDSWFPWGMQ